MIIHYLCTTLLFVFINMQRIVLFDIAKALCIVLVVVGHYFPENSPVWYECLNKLIYSFHMPLFMFASGFIYMATKKEGESYSKFLVKKLKRLMLPYVVVSVIVISIKMLTEKHAFVENPVTAYAYIKMLYFPEAGYFLWFIWALWWMFVIAPLFATKQKRLLLLGAALLLYSSVSAGSVLFQTIPEHVGVFYAWCCLLRLEQDCNIRKNSALGCMPVICRA